VALVSSLRTRILLADDHAVVRRGLRLVLDAEPDLQVVAEAADGLEALAIGLREDIDLAVLDVAMPGLTGLQVAREFKARRPELRSLLLSMHDSAQYLFEALRAGASGYVLKADADHTLIEACRAAVRGEPFLYPEGISALVREHFKRVERGEPVGSDPLTDRETQVVKLIAEGHSGREIAKLLQISEHTVERHREHILDKLGLRDRVALTRYAIRRGLVEP
jgi:DNA-binding NarL/FixJ family response regulator